MWPRPGNAICAAAIQYPPRAACENRDSRRASAPAASLSQVTVTLGSGNWIGGFGAQLALFQIAQQSGAVDPATNLFGFIGLQRNRGAEIQVFGEAAPGLRLLGGVAFIDARLVATPGGSNDGRKAPGVPDAAVSFQAEYDPRILPGLTLFGRAIYTDPVYFDAANRQRLPDWIRFDLGLRYAALVGGRSVVFRAAVENVTDVSYWQTAGRSLLSLGSQRTILVSASFDL